MLPPSGGVRTPVRRAARWGRLWGCAPFIPMPNPVLRALGRHRRRCRRAVRHENQSLTARQSRDLLLISGRVDVANTPPGLRPFCPCIPPPKHPLRAFSISEKRRGQRGICCGSFLPSLRSLRRSPSATRNARFRLSFDQSPFQPELKLLFALKFTVYLTAHPPNEASLLKHTSLSLV